MQRRPASDEATRARLFGKRSALVLCSTVAAWFMVASVAQIVPAVFGAGIVPLGAGAGSPERSCAESLRKAADASAAADEDRSFLPCTETSPGLDALAALRRLRMAEETLGQRAPESLAALRLELAAHLPAEMR